MGNGRRGKGEKGLSVAGINYAQAYDPTGWADDIYNQPIQAFNYTLSSRSRISVPRGQEHTHTHTQIDSAVIKPPKSSWTSSAQCELGRNAGTTF
jgi:hypothetical protein